MGYRRYRSYRYRNWGSNPPSKYSKLQGMFGDAVPEIKNKFFQLEPDATNELLLDYGVIHGKSAENYARKTIPKWRNGTTKLSGQTMERLIELVPPYFSAKQRLEILNLILAQNKRPTGTQTIKVNVKEPELGLKEIDAALNEIKITDELAYLPSHVMDAAKWLYDDDVTATRAILVSIAAAETNALKQSAEREINLLKRTLRADQIKAASYTVKTPGGNLSIVAYTPSLCFVATRCFGQNDVRTRIFRHWRDEVLLNYKTGQKFVVWYYLNGELLARALSSHFLIFALTKCALSVAALVLSFVHLMTAFGKRVKNV